MKIISVALVVFAAFGKALGNESLRGAKTALETVAISTATSTENESTVTLVNAAEDQVCAINHMNHISAECYEYS